MKNYIFSSKLNHDNIFDLLNFNLIFNHYINNYCFILAKREKNLDIVNNKHFCLFDYILKSLLIKNLQNFRLLKVVHSFLKEFLCNKASFS